MFILSMVLWEMVARCESRCNIGLLCLVVRGLCDVLAWRLVNVYTLATHSASKATGRSAQGRSDHRTRRYRLCHLRSSRCR
jgi:hypothetical protein